MCTPKVEIDDGAGITIEFLQGLNDDPNFQLFKNSDGFYELTLDQSRNQTIQRITGRLSKNDEPVIDLWSGGQPKKISFESNLYWWLLEGDTVANITYTYINQFNGQLQYVNLPPLINWQDQLVTTINISSYTNEETGVFNTVIAPIREMKGDTMKIIANYNHSVTSKEEGSKFFEIIGNRQIKDSIYIILK